MRAAWRVAGSIENKDRPCFRVSNETATGIPKVYVYDVIGGWDLDAQEFVKEIHSMDSDEIDVHVNSPGGFVYDAVAMYEALQSHKAKINMRIDGLAASAASMIAMAGDTIQIVKAGRMMIHDAQVIAYGSPADLREAADLGDAISDDIAGVYADRAGGTASEWRERMSATTWYSAQQALDANLVDTIKSGAENSIDKRTQMVMARARVALGRIK